MAKSKNKDTNASLSKFSFYFLLFYWIAFVIEEVVKESVYAFYYHDHDVWVYAIFHICSVTLISIPLTIFTKKSKFHSVFYNFNIYILFITSLTFILGLDTPSLFTSDPHPIYWWHSYFWHISQVILLAHFFVIRKPMYREKNNLLYTSLLVLAMNLIIFYYSQLFFAAGFDGPVYVLYNRNPEPFYSLAGKDQYLTNFYLLIFVAILCELGYIAYYYADKGFAKLKLASV